MDPFTPGGQNPFDPDVADSTGDNQDPHPDGIPDGQNDWDGDSMTNADEFRWGYNPTDPESFGVLPISTRPTLGVTAGLLALAGVVSVCNRKRYPKPNP